MTLDELKMVAAEATHDEGRTYTENLDARARFDETFGVEMVKKLLAVAEAAKVALDDWYFDESSKGIRRALAALESTDG